MGVVSLLNCRNLLHNSTLLLYGDSFLKNHKARERKLKNLFVWSGGLSGEISFISFIVMLPRFFPSVRHAFIFTHGEIESMSGNKNEPI